MSFGAFWGKRTMHSPRDRKKGRFKLARKGWWVSPTAHPAKPKALWFLPVPGLLQEVKHA